MTFFSGTRQPIKCFQIRQQKCFKWFSVCFKSLLGYFGVTVRVINLFRRLGETLAVSNVSGGFFVSSETVSYPKGSGRKFEDMG